MIGPSIWRWPSIGPGTGSAMRSGPAWSAISCWSPSLARAIPGCSATIAECWSRHDLLCPAPEPARDRPGAVARRAGRRFASDAGRESGGAGAGAGRGQGLRRARAQFASGRALPRSGESPVRAAPRSPDTVRAPVTRRLRSVPRTRRAPGSGNRGTETGARIAPEPGRPLGARAGDAETEPNAGDIAIIGMAGRFPGADSPAALWSRLAAGELLVREVPPERWSTARFYDPDPAVPHRTVSKWAGLLDGIDRFDAGFFGISPREAAAMDPQQRLFLETAWHAFENAGYPAERLKGGAIGVYVGAAADGWERLLPSDSAATQSYGMTGNLVSLLAARISYFLDLQGPALVLDTACSASLVAVHLACRALLAGEVEMALAGGVRLFLDEQPFLMMSRLGMLSPDGRCRSFDAGANGIAIGEACAAIVLKPLARALRDGDWIDAVIKATGVNQDGRSNGITAPNPAAQARLLRRVLAEARVPADTIGYIEAHGTATPLGDPIEVAALGTVYAATS